GLPEKEYRAARRPLHRAGFVPRTQTHVDGEDRRHAAVWWRPAQPLEEPAHEFAVDEGAYERTLSPSYLLLDLRLGRNAGRLRTAIAEALSPLATVPSAGLAGLPWAMWRNLAPWQSAGAPERDYSYVRHSSARFVSVEAHGLSVGEHARRCRAWAARGYRPQALSVAAFPPGAGREASLAASVWHRPVVPEADLDDLARRQAQAAVALVRLGQGGEVWPLLRHGSDPRLRSYLVQRLRRLGADPLSLWARF